MSPSQHIELVSQFNDCINRQDIARLAEFMTDDHALIDSAGGSVRGKEAVLAAWRGFFKAFSDYRNVFEQYHCRGGLIVISGCSTCSDKRLDGPAIWTATLRRGKLSEWRVYEDTRENRQRLGLRTDAVRPE